MTDNHKCSRECGALRIIHTDGGSVNWYRHFGSCLAGSIKTERSPTTPSLHPTKMRAHVQQETYTRIFINSLFKV